MWEKRGFAYAIGANAKGIPIFKNKKEAYEQALIDYKMAIEYIEKVKQHEFYGNILSKLNS